MAAPTCRVLPLSTREAVASDTPACLATSSRVTTRPSTESDFQVCQATWTARETYMGVLRIRARREVFAF
ncbi:hypothetical protein GCM10009555_036980 [Acrocarpospora macrocephala]|uniref:Uncharacterized protein n=1 Tax=Acrocarpospora macrocephala TaxID=150177 RepID=A0A5M3WZC9_9ACTN|nr:hypothetical protein Amac_068560 [Acrocarpospora macrocephala]